MPADDWHRYSAGGSRSNRSLQSIEGSFGSSSGGRIRLIRYGDGLWSVSCSLLYSREHGEQAFNFGSGYGLEAGSSSRHGVLGH